MGTKGLSPLEHLRHQGQEHWLEELQQRLAETLGDLPCRVWLLGSRGWEDWHGYTDIDRLVEVEGLDWTPQCHVPEICEQSRCSFSRIGSAVAGQLKGAKPLL
jgi:hypothetical protein